MNLDFSKIGTGNSVDTILQPREIFNALPLKNATKYQYPRDVQSQVWAKWFERRNEKSLVVKMNTGSGKTVVGLLMLKSCLNEGKGPAVFICPDTYLMKQVMDSAKELGVEVTDDVQSNRFLSGKAVLVTNIFKLVNGMSVFGVGDEGVKLKISSLVIDDAHACLNYVEDQFSINIPQGTVAYSELYEIFKASLHNQCQSKAVEIEEGVSTSCMQVPYWVWQDKIADVTRILGRHVKEDYLKFAWPLVKEDPKLSHCVVSSSGIEITPHSIPIHMIPAIVEADRKIFMTATLVDDSILVSHFGVEEEFVKNPIIPDSAGDVGDRMILLPQVINSDTTNDQVKEYCKYVSGYVNVVVIVPSSYRAKYWQDCADLTLTADNLYEGVERLKAGRVGLVVLINKYDGVDLPGNACRLLVIDGFPDVRRKIDKVKQSILAGSKRYVDQIVQRIEQGMGRGVRSNDDYCVVFLVGKDLTNQLYAQGGLSKLSPATKAQLTLSDQLSEQIKGQPLKDITNTINYCLSRNADWVKASKGALATLKYAETSTLDAVTLTLRRAYEYAARNNTVKAAEQFGPLVNGISYMKERGYIKQLYAEYTNLSDKVEAQKLQMSAVADNRRVLKPVEGINYHKISGAAFDQAMACSKYLTEKHQDPNKLVIEINGVLDGLQFKEDTSELFEETMKVVARYIGYESQRPEQEYQKGPDVLWKIGDLNYLVIECKNEAVVDTINKGYCNQLNGSCEWFEEKYDSSCKYVPVMVHPSVVFEYAASPNKAIRIMDKQKLQVFCDAVREFITSIAVNNEISDVAAIRKKIIFYKLRAIDFCDNYTSSFRSKSR